MFAGGRYRDGELQAAFSASARSHLRNTQSQPSHQSILQLRRDSGVTERRERRHRERNTEKEREILVSQQSQTGLLLFSSVRSTLATFQSFWTTGTYSNTSHTDSVVAKHHQDHIYTLCQWLDKRPVCPSVKHISVSDATAQVWWANGRLTMLHSCSSFSPLQTVNIYFTITVKMVALSASYKPLQTC